MWNVGEDECQNKSYEEYELKGLNQKTYRGNKKTKSVAQYYEYSKQNKNGGFEGLTIKQLFKT